MFRLFLHVKKAAGDLNKTNGNLNRINGNVNKNNGNLNRPICLKNFCILNNGQQSELTFQFNQILTNKMEPWGDSQTAKDGDYNGATKSTAASL